MYWWFLTLIDVDDESGQKLVYGFGPFKTTRQNATHFANQTYASSLYYDVILHRWNGYKWEVICGCAGWCSDAQGFKPAAGDCK